MLGFRCILGSPTKLQRSVELRKRMFPKTWGVFVREKLMQERPRLVKVLKRYTKTTNCKYLQIWQRHAVMFSCSHATMRTHTWGEFNGIATLSSVNGSCKHKVENHALDQTGGT
jgi:hypothetical protein